MPLAGTQAFFHLKASNILFCPPHISESQQEAEIADHHSLVITSATFSRNCQKSPCDSPNIFSPSPSTSRVVHLLPTVPDGVYKLCLHPPGLVCIRHTHTLTHTNRFAEVREKVLQMWCRQIASYLNVKWSQNIFLNWMQNNLIQERLKRESLPFALLGCTALYRPKWESPRKVVRHSKDILTEYWFRRGILMLFRCCVWLFLWLFNDYFYIPLS